MLYPNHWWHRLTPTAHHRIEVIVIAVLAFTGGLAVSPFGRSATGSFLDREAAQPALVAPATNNQSVVASIGAEMQRAMGLYREGERALYPRTEPAGTPANVDQDLQRAMQLYREGERALYPRTERLVPAADAGKEWQRTMQLYRAGERALYPAR